MQLIIDDLKFDLLNLEHKLIIYVKRTKEYNNAYMAVKLQKNEISELERLITWHNNRLFKWVQEEPEELELYLERIDNEAKRITREKKEAKRITREKKSIIKAKKDFDELMANNFHRVIYQGDVVVEWQSTHETDRQYINAMHQARFDYHATLPDIDENGDQKSEVRWFGNSLIVETRTKANGKGKCLWTTKIKY